MSFLYGVQKITMVRFLFLSLLIFAVSDIALAQSGIKWYTWEEGMVKSEKENKKFVIDMYTDWCGWCKKMDSSTFSDPQIAHYVNTNYIAIKFDAEQKGNITFRGEEHSFVKSGRRGYHTLAAKLTNDRLSYPTVVFLDENMDLIQAIPGFQDAKTFDPILIYFAEDLHKQMSWNSFIQSYDDRPKPQDGARMVKGN